ncbi:MAG TPA: zinc-dependent alcohol dehydrogenase [Verrucomicrobiae bacterium]|nr:zinc-dependent alcohol dehydrogenase [Verrucomicrobiae bacterium]
MKATCWHGYHDIRVQDVEDPKILNPRDAIVRVTSTAICGSDLHLYDGFVPTMEKGDILGHEFMGEVVEVGAGVKNLKAGDRVVVPFPIACGNCFFCKRDLYSLCENSNPNAASAEKMWGHAPCGIFGYSHLTGGYAGGQAEYVRVPFADVGPTKIENGLPDEKVLFLTDIFPTAWMAAENANIAPGDTVAVWGCGPVGLLTIKSAYLQGAGRVIAIDRVPERLRLAKEKAGAEVLDFSRVENIVEELKELTGGRGPDSCIDAVGMEAEGHGVIALYDKVKNMAMQQTDRPTAIRQAIMAVRNGGTISIPGVYGGFVDKFPLGSIMNRSLTIRTGQTHVHRYTKPLLARIEKGEIDPSFIITHEMKLSDAAKGYDLFVKKKDECIKVILKP